MKFKVALLQMLPVRNLTVNLEKGQEFCRKANRMDADLALFPEMWSNGYQLPQKDEELNDWLDQAIDPGHNFIHTFRNLAAELEMSIGLTFLEKYNPAPKNSFILIDSKGEIQLHYSKVHTCEFSEEKHLTPGTEFPICELEFKKGSVKLGTMICFDREFPESARILMLKGAEIILVPNACEIDINRKAQLRSRAFENMTGIVMANYAGDPCGGNSLAFDGMAYTPALGGEDGDSRDMLIVEAGSEEGIFLAEFDLNDLRRYRKDEVWGNKHRRPETYSLLAEI